LYPVGIFLWRSKNAALASFCLFLYNPYLCSQFRKPIDFFNIKNIPDFGFNYRETVNLKK
jgi:hypothetical protein